MLGFFNVRKPPGPTSHDVVDQVRRLLGRQVKVGHCGTLDPFAEGVLVIAVGPATRLARYIQDQPKRYVATVRLGGVSTTDDPQGRITPTAGVAVPSGAAVGEALRRFVGQIMQVPPAHSAVHVQGKRAYKLARRGQPVELPARPVTIHEIRLVRYDWPLLELEVRCGAGTYIRAVARDLGAALGVGGYCSALARTEVGPFLLADAVPPDRLEPPRDLLPAREAVAHLPAVIVDDAAARRLMRGQPLAAGPETPPGEVAVLSPAGALLAIVRAEAGGILRPAIVLAG